MKLVHGRTTLALHCVGGQVGGKLGGKVGATVAGIAAAEGPPLLLLHALGSSSAEWREPAVVWPGPVYALDFSGHGRSDNLLGGGYAPEIFVAEADTALAWINEQPPTRASEHEVYLAGRGVAAYVALLLAGARPASVGGVLLLPGRGLEGGGPLPSEDPANRPAPADDCDLRPDPLVWSCETDIRPIAYAEEFASAARRLLIPQLRGDATAPWIESARKHAVPASPHLREALDQLRQPGRT